MKFTGSHAGVSIGEDGPSQMALEDLSMMRGVPGCAVLYPCDAVSTERLVVEMGEARRHGLHAHVASEDAGDLRTRGGVPDRRLEGAASERPNDVAAVVGAGITVFEALKAYDSAEGGGHRDPRHRRVFRPADRRQDDDRGRDRPPAACSSPSRITIRPAARRRGARGGRAGGLRGAPARGAARFPRSGQPDELVDRYGISARHIVEAVKESLITDH